ncbi:MAG: hypothetical protein ACOYLQ_10330 [Hyphomicrobiaceae bacterium]
MTMNPIAERSPVRLVVWTILTVALAGAVYLYAVRGPALLLDLAAGAAGILCL